MAMAAVLTGLVATGVPVAPASAAADVAVIVMGTPQSEPHLPGLVERQGGVVTGHLDFVDAVVADVPADRLDALASAPGVRYVAADREVRTASVMPTGYNQTTDAASMHSVARQTRAYDLWMRGITGAGVDVAVVDTGVTGHSALQEGSKFISAPAFTTSSGGNSNWDANGHGTHMAAIAGGRTWDPSESASVRYGNGHYTGMAPMSRIVAVKVAENNGTTTLSQVMLGIEWVIQNRRSNGLNIRVLNLSVAATPAASPSEDPLAQGAVAAWNAGIVVVAAAGNTGKGTPLSSPAYEPRIISVGALDHRGTVSPTDDTVASFTAGGTSGSARPDLFAPGRSIVGALGSDSAANASGTRVGSESGRSYVRGSGTSQAAAVVSGAAALLISQRPSLTPDQVAALLRTGALPVGSVANARLDLVRSADAPTPDTTTSSPITTATSTSAGGDLSFARRGATWSTDSWAKRGATWSGGFAARSWT